MQSFIVLGIIPGTNIQTNLNFWIIVSSLLVLIAMRTQLIAMRNFVQLIMATHKIARTINQFEITATA